MGKMTIDGLSRLREQYRDVFAVRQGAGRARINVHMGTCGINAGAGNILTAIMSEIEQRNLHDVLVTNSGCAGQCELEPMITIDVTQGLPSTTYVHLTPEKVKKIFDQHILNNQIVTECTAGRL